MNARQKRRSFISFFDMKTEQCERGFKDPLLTMILCVLIEKQDKGNLGQKGLSDNTKVAFGTTKDHG